MDSINFLVELLSSDTSTDNDMAVSSKSVESADESTFLTSRRHLEEIIETEGGVSDTRQFDPVIFWSVNAIWISVLLVIIIWFWKFNGSARLTAWTQAMVSQESDLAYRRRVANRQREKIEAKRITPEERVKILQKYFRSNNVHMVVTEADLVKEDEPLPVPAAAVAPAPAAPPLSMDDIETGASDGLMLEEDGLFNCNNVTETETDQKAEEAVLAIDSGVGLDESIRSIDQGYLLLKNQARHVPNCCAVCLGSYDVGESVVWSANPSCQHAFHEECVTDWLIKIQEGNPCPCCRSIFADVDMDLPKQAKKQIRWEAGSTMNVNVISL